MRFGLYLLAFVGLIGGYCYALISSPERSYVEADDVEPETLTAILSSDALPAGFPRYPGAAEASVGRGPASAELTVAADPAAVVTALQTALEGAGYRTVTVWGPMEDGSRTIESEGTTPGCRVGPMHPPLVLVRFTLSP